MFSQCGACFQFMRVKFQLFPCNIPYCSTINSILSCSHTNTYSRVISRQVASFILKGSSYSRAPISFSMSMRPSFLIVLAPLPYRRSICNTPSVCLLQLCLNVCRTITLREQNNLQRSLCVRTTTQLHILLFDQKNIDTSLLKLLLSFNMCI